MTKQGRPRGFTLIELLVTISVIALLSTLALITFTGVREKARDTRRKSDVAQIVNALNLYYDTFGHYPTIRDNKDVDDWQFSYHVSGFINPLKQVTNSRIPYDPVNNLVDNVSVSAWRCPEMGFSYAYQGEPGDIDEPTGYYLVTCLENSNDADANGSAFPVGCDQSGSCWDSNLYIVHGSI